MNPDTLLSEVLNKYRGGQLYDGAAVQSDIIELYLSLNNQGYIRNVKEEGPNVQKFEEAQQGSSEGS